MNKNIKEYIQHISTCLNFDRERVKDLIGSGRFLMATQLIDFCREFELSPYLLMKQKLDMEILYEQRVKRNFLKFPKKYSDFSYSSTTSLSSVLDAIEIYDKKEYVLSQLQIDKRALLSHHKLSIMAIIDCFNILAPVLNSNDLTKIGFHNSAKFLNQDIGKQFQECRSPHELVEIFVDNVKYIERNWDYEIIKFRSNEIEIKTWNSKEMQEGNQTYTNDYTNSCKISFIKFLYWHLGYKNVVVKMNQFNQKSKTGIIKVLINEPMLSHQVPCIDQFFH